MWPQKNLGWWELRIGILGIGVGIVGILATVPLTVFGNLITPYIKDWFASRSRASLQKRILQLEGDLSELEARESITAIESYTIQRIEQLEDALLASVHMLLTAIFFGVIAVISVIATTSEGPNKWVYWFLSWMLFAISFNFARTILKDRPSTRFRLPDRELSLEKDIAKLRADLAPRQ